MTQRTAVSADVRNATSFAALNCGNDRKVNDR
jgi:hypothetical protein